MGLGLIKNCISILKPKKMDNLLKLSTVDWVNNLIINLKNSKTNAKCI